MVVEEEVDVIRGHRIYQCLQHLQKDCQPVVHQEEVEKVLEKKDERSEEEAVVSEEDQQVDPYPSLPLEASEYKESRVSCPLQQECKAMIQSQ